jgi:hypothetical protein
MRFWPATCTISRAGFALSSLVIMTLPNFRFLAARRHAIKQEKSGTDSPTDNECPSERVSMPTVAVDLKVATKTRRAAILAGCIFFFITPIVLYSRWWSFPVAVWTFIAALFTVAATIIGTAMAVIFKTAITSQPGLNIEASLGNVMLIFMWIASAFSIFGFAIHLCLSCCCASKRDVRTGRRMGNKAAYTSAISNEKNRSAGGRFGMPQISRFRGKRGTSQVAWDRTMHLAC